MAFLSGYTTRRKITINKDKIDSNLTDFPVLVKLTSTNFDFAKANSDGYDIRFTSDDGTTLLKYERERHDATNKLAEYWVKIPSISSTANTDFYIYYRTTDTDDGADPTNVWDSSFKMVQHMNDKTTSTIEDSTANNNDGTKKGANEPNQVDGKIGKAQDFDGVDDKIDLGFNTNYTSAFTLEAWVKKDVDVASGRNYEIISKRSFPATSYTDFPFVFCIDNNQKILFALSRGDDYSLDLSLFSTTVLDNSSYYYVAATYTASGNSYLFVNGSQEASGSNNFTIPTNTRNWVLGRASYPGANKEQLDGKLDEVRISNTARSSAWIKASYNSGNNSLVSYGGEEGEGIDNVLFFGCNF